MLNGMFYLTWFQRSEQCSFCINCTLVSFEKTGLLISFTLNLFPFQYKNQRETPTKYNVQVCLKVLSSRKKNKNFGANLIKIG